MDFYYACIKSNILVNTPETYIVGPYPTLKKVMDVTELARLAGENVKYYSIMATQILVQVEEEK